MAIFKKKEHALEDCIYAPTSGKVVALELVEDPVFANKMMGEGIAIDIDCDFICAPADGVVSLIAQSKHAFGMILENGVEIMVHVGLESVNLQGQGFTALVSQQDHVRMGTPILKIDRSFMKERNISLITPIIILNHSEHPFEIVHLNDYITSKEPLFKFIAK